MSAPLLLVDGLQVLYRVTGGEAAAVDGISFAVERGETLAIVGESGCGKSATALALLGLVPPLAGRVACRQLLLDGEDLSRLRPRDWCRVRGKRIAMIFQEPMTSLNPVLTIGLQLTEAIRTHEAVSERAAVARVLDTLALVRIPEPRRYMRAYPHQLSGGMRQRVMIAMAIGCSPDLLVADEPTTALDVTIQAQILDLLLDLQARLGMAMILITHDLAVVGEVADRVLVMYAGRIVEEAPAAAVFETALHPYTRGLAASIPRLDRFLATGGRTERLAELAGIVPAIDARPPGCSFADRCPLVTDICRTERPEPMPFGPGRRAACWHAA